MGFLTMDQYDEDLFENIFFQTLQNKFPQLFEELTSKQWMVMVPRCGALEKMKFEQQDFESHILLPMDDQPTVFLTVNQKEISIKGNAITTRNGFGKKKTVAILFEETFFNKNNKSYRVLCINQPLEGGAGVDDDCKHLAVSTMRKFTYDDCCQILWGDTGNRNTKSSLAYIVDAFVRTLSKKTFASFKLLMDQVNLLYKKCVNIVMKDRLLRKNALSDSDFKTSIFIAVETYLMQHIYHSVFRRVCTFMAEKDVNLNKITRNFTDLQLQQLSIRQKFCRNIPRARTELAYVFRWTSPRKKLNCLKRVLKVLITDFSQPVNNTGAINTADHSADLSPFGSDDLLSILVFLIMKTEIPNWWSQWAFMKNFCLATPSLSSEFECFLSNLEAALEYITSGQLRELRSENDTSNLMLNAALSGSPTSQDNATQSLVNMFQMIANNNKDGVRDFLTEPETESEIDLPIDRLELLCHPLCDCSRCFQLMNSSGATKRNSHVGVLSKNDQGMSAIHVASVFGNIDMVDLLIENGADVNAANQMGLTPLHIAAQRGHQKLIMLFLHHNALINQKDKKQNTPLHWASANGHIDCVKALIYIGQNNRKPVDLDVTNDVRDTALHLAAKWGYENIVGMLLEHGASPCIPNRKYQTACDVAHNSHIYELLLEAVVLEKSSTNQTLTKSDHHKSSRLTRTLSINVVHQSSNHSESREKSEPPATAPVIKSGCTVFPTLTEAKTPPVSSPTLDKKVEKLLKSVADGDIQMVKHHLGWSEFEYDYPEVSEIDLTKVTLCHPLCQCDKCWHIQKLTLPSTSGIDLNSQNAQGYTPLHVAALHGHVSLVQLLLKKGAKVSACTKANNTPLHFACKQRHMKVVQLLIEYGAEIMARDNDENTPLHYCCLSGNLTHAWLLLQGGAEVNAVNNKGNTALHIAVKHGHELITQTLIYFGADVGQHNCQMKMPVSSITTKEMSDCVNAARAQHLWRTQGPILSNWKRFDCHQPCKKFPSSSDLFTSCSCDCSSVTTSCDHNKFQSIQSLDDMSVANEDLGHLSRDDRYLLTFMEAVRHVTDDKLDSSNSTHWYTV